MPAPVVEGCRSASDPEVIASVAEEARDHQLEPHVRPRHQRAAGRPGRAEAVRGARGGAPRRGDHRAGGQASPSRAGVLRAERTADARRPADHPRPPRRAGARRLRGRHHPGRAQPHRPRLAAVRLPARRQRHPDPRRGPQPVRRGPRRHARLEGPAAAHQGVGRRPGRRGLPRRRDQRLRPRLLRHGRARRDRGRARRAVRRRLDRPARRPRAALPLRPGAALRPRHRPGPGRSRQAGAPGARRPRGVRHPRPLGRAADRPGDAARPRGRDRLPRRAGRHRASPPSRCVPASRR